jgi:uncharacterized protein
MDRLAGVSSGAAVALWALAAALPARAEPPVPAPQGFVTDLAGVISPSGRARITRLIEELREKTGAEIAVVTVETTQPLDDFSYALRIAETWKPGRKGEDTGIVFLVAVRDRKLRILVGYGLEGILPDGLVGEIEDREVIPAFRAGRVEDGIWRGVAALAARIAAERGVELGGAPRTVVAPPAPPGWVLLLVVLLLLALVLYQASRPPGFRRRRGVYYPPFGFGGFGAGGFGGGGGGFGGFGGGSFGGGGAGRSW